MGRNLINKRTGERFRELRRGRLPWVRVGEDVVAKWDGETRRKEAVARGFVLPARFRRSGGGRRAVEELSVTEFLEAQEAAAQASRGMTLTDVAEAARVDRALVSKFERGEGIALATLRALLQGIGYAPGDGVFEEVVGIWMGERGEMGWGSAAVNRAMSRGEMRVSEDAHDWVGRVVGVAGNLPGDDREDVLWLLERGNVGALAREVRRAAAGA